MKTYDFDRIVDRHGTNAVKYDALTDVFGRKELLPLWVADMDFATPDFILDALRRRLDHPVLGYTQLPDDYWPQIAAWIEARHGWRPDPAWMRFIPGIVKGIGMAVLALTRPGDKVVIQPPVYHPFRLVPEQMGRRVVCNPLRRRFFGWLEAGEFHEAPLLSAVATRAAFTPEGDAWRRQMLRYVEANVDFTDDFLRRYVPRIRAIRPEASFLVWLDCRKLGLAHDALVDLFVARAGLALNDGEMFGPGGEGHMRLNVGLPRIRLAEALERLRAAVDAR